jgi:hypothetical protein
MGIQWGTAAELASLVQRPLVDTVTCNLLLSQAADLVRAECNQNIDIVTTTEVLDGPRSATYMEPDPADAVVFLNEKPVISVTSVTELQVANGMTTLVQGTDFILGNGGRIYRIKSSSASSYSYYPWTVNKQGITVIYSHGYATTTWQYNTAKQISLQMAGRAYVNPEGLHQMRVGGYAARYFGTTTPITGMLQMTPFEKLMLAPLRANTLTA